MDCIALEAVNCFLRRGKKHGRIVAAAVLSSVGSLVLTMTVHDRMIRLLCVHFILNTAMVFLCFGKSTKREFWENWAATYAAVMFLGGFMEFFGSLPWKKQRFFVQGAAAAVILSLVTYYLGRRKQFGGHLYPAQLIHHGKTKELKAYWDSGNQLKNPYSGKPVCILSRSLAKEVVCGNERVWLVPYTSLGQENGLILVTQIECLRICDGKKQIEIKPAEVGIANEGLLEHREYDLILHASLLGDR